ncbi:hypothetical protein Q5752_005427 [Cryptotrichosporon argae]
MPRIRKKTSNRQNTRDRAKVERKVREFKKKDKRDSKRNVTWKSKKKADPGVPNSFHLKDQVLAELAAEKRASAEERDARRQAQRAAAKQVEGDDDPDVPGISSVPSSTILSRPAQAGTSVLPSVEVADVPQLVDTDLPTLQAALDRADVVVEVVDARDVAGGRSRFLEGLVKETEGTLVLAVNKIDLVPREALEAILASSPLPTFLVSSSTSLGISQLRSYLATLASQTLTLVGLPGVGKTSLLNALLGSGSFKTATPGSAAAAKAPAPTTAAPVEVEVKVLGGTVKVIDTPGWEFVEDDEGEGEDGDEDMDETEQDEGKWDELEARVAGDLLRRNLGRIDRVKDVFPLVNYIVKRSNATDLMLVYNVPYFEQGNVEAFLTGLARANARIKKHGAPDLESAARILLRDWALATFPYYSLPSPATATAAGQLDMSAVLAAAKGRKEMKAAGRGLVRFTAGEVDGREVFLDDDYTEAFAPERDDEDEDGDEDEQDGEEDDEDEDEDEDEDDEEDDGFVYPVEGEELDLPSGPEPSSGSSVPSSAASSPEPSPEPEPARGKRKARLSSPGPQRKKARTKSVVFAAAHEGRSAARDVANVRGILKRAAAGDDGAEEREVGKKRKRESVGGGRKVPRTAEAEVERKGNGKAKAEAVEVVKVTKAAKAKPAAEKEESAKPAKEAKAKATKVKADKPAAAKAKGAAKEADGEAYDFSKHFF